MLETLALLEESGVNAIIADPRKKPMDVFKAHWKRGGKIQWIAEGHPTPDDLKTNIKASIDWGALGGLPPGRHRRSLAQGKSREQAR